MTQPPLTPKRTVVVTGGGAGIGREIALAFAGAGWHVHICGRTLAPLADVARRDHITYSQCDITDEAQVAAMFADAVSVSGRIEAVVLNAGLPGTPAEFGDTDIEDFRRVIDTNVVGSFLCAREAFRIMKGTGGRILVNCSIAAQVPRAHTAAYAASKSALAGLTRVLALDGREHGILATRIDIGNAKTDLLGAFTGEDGAEPMFDAAEAARAFVYAAELPATAVVDHLTITAAGMPFLGRG
nr:SDR family oxidoreductase [Corynebacterium lactis]